MLNAQQLFSIYDIISIFLQSSLSDDDLFEGLRPPMIFFFSAIDDADLVDLAFGGEDLDHLLLLSKKHLYKVTGLLLSLNAEPKLL